MSISANQSILTIQGGTFNASVTPETRISSGLERLTGNIAVTALHNSGQFCDPPRCLPGTRELILDFLEGEVSATAGRSPIIWFQGSAGAGKTAIMRTLAERLARERLLLADFFYFRTDPRRNNPLYLIPTLAYQVYQCLPTTRPHIEDAIETNPIIFSLSIEEQLQTLIITPLNLAFSKDASSITPGVYPHVILIDGLDECQGEEEQVKIIKVFSEALGKFSYPISLLIASRPEPNIRSIFDAESVKECCRTVALDGAFNPDADILWFYRAKFQIIRSTHPLRAYLPTPWPRTDILDFLVQKASGQFIFADTVIKFTGSMRHKPSTQLDVLLDVLRTHNDHRSKPFQQLDLLYSAIFQRVDKDDLPIMLRLLGMILIPRIPYKRSDSISFRCMPKYLEHFLGWPAGEVSRLLLDLGSLVLVAGETSDITVFHASLADFIFNKSRSGGLFINRSMVYTDISAQYLHHPHLLNVDIAEYELPHFLELAAPTPYLRDIILQVDLNTISNSPGSTLAKHLRNIAPNFWKAVAKSKFPDAHGLSKQIQEKWVKALTAQVRQYWLNPTSKMLVIAASIFPRPGPAKRIGTDPNRLGYSYLNNAAMPHLIQYSNIGHFIHIIEPPLSPEIVHHDQNAFALLNEGAFGNNDLFYPALVKTINSIYGPDTFTDVAVHLRKIMLGSKTSDCGSLSCLAFSNHQYCPLTRLRSDFNNIPRNRVKEGLAPALHLNSHPTLGYYIRSLFPAALDASTARMDLITILQHREDISEEYQVPQLTLAVERYLNTKPACKATIQEPMVTDTGESVAITNFYSFIRTIFSKAKPGGI